MKSFRYMLAGLLALCSFAFVGAMPASAHMPGFSQVQADDAGDWLAPLLATFVDVAVVPATPSSDEPGLAEVSSTGPVAAVYRLSYLTDAASLRRFHWRC